MTPLTNIRAIFLSLLLACMIAAPARAETAPAQTIWRLLDYIAVDYSAAVSRGRVADGAEYAEMVEFSNTVVGRLEQLPATPTRAALVRDGGALRALIESKADPAAVAMSARQLARALLTAYPVPLAPSGLPDRGRAAALYSENCASCHGMRGDGRGPAAIGMDPPPIDFTDLARARERSIFGLYQVIEQGLEGTAMPPFAHLTADERWALAFHAGSYAYPPDLVASGKAIWSSNTDLRRRIPDLAALIALTPAQLEETLTPKQARAVIAYLRAQPETLAANAQSSLSLAKSRLGESLAAYERGDRRAATDRALSAYLDGFEPIEPLLTARDPALMRTIESAMAELRARIGRGAPAREVQAQIERVQSLFSQAEERLGPESASTTSSFAGAFTVLLREGLEALLIVIAMIAFLRKAERQDVLRYVHGGWIAALTAGAATWAIATYVIGISGAGREVTEGLGSLFAAVVLLSVGIWMHGKAQAGAWQRYIAERLTHALSKRSAWFLFGLTFLVVYREVFETILFYAALWSQGNGGAIASGAAAAIGVLAVIAVAMLRYSRRLPIATFFRYSSILIAGLVIVLAGKGVAGLQEAGWIDVTPVALIPRVDLLGLYPTAQSVVTQLVAIAAILFGFWITQREASRAVNIVPPGSS